MAGLDTTNDGFGIENTMSVDSTGAGNSALLDELYSPETSAADPNDISSLEDDPITNNNDGGGDDGSDSPDGDQGDDPGDVTTDGKKIPKSKTNDPTALTNFLIGEEEEEEEEEEDDDDEPNPSDKNKSGSGRSEEEEDDDEDDKNPGIIAFDSLANELANLGVFSREEGEEEGLNVQTPEDFLERFKKETQKGAQTIVSDFIGQFGQEYQEAFQAIYVNGMNPKEYFSKAGEIQNFTNMDLTKENNQEKVVREVLKDQGFDSDDIDSEIEKLKNYGDLEDVSKRHHKVLIKKEKEALKQEEENAKIANRNKFLAKQEYADNVNTVLAEKLKAKEFDGIPLNTRTANELQDFLLVDKWKTSSGDTLTDFDKAILDLKRPENHANKVKIALLLKLLEKDPTLSTIQKRGVSKGSSQLFKDVARQKTAASSKSGTNKKQPAKSWFQQ